MRSFRWCSGARLKNSPSGLFGADRILHFVQDDKKVSLCHLFVISATLSFRGEAEESFLQILVEKILRSALDDNTPIIPLTLAPSSVVS